MSYKKPVSGKHSKKGSSKNNGSKNYSTNSIYRHISNRTDSKTHGFGEKVYQSSKKSTLYKRENPVKKLNYITNPKS